MPRRRDWAVVLAVALLLSGMAVGLAQAADDPNDIEVDVTPGVAKELTQEELVERVKQLQAELPAGAQRPIEATLTQRTMGPIAQTLMFGHVRETGLMLDRIMRRLHKPASPADRGYADKSYTYGVVGIPLPNAMIDTSANHIAVTLGLLGFFGTEGELAFVLAHEMTHGNPEQLKALKDTKEIEDILSRNDFTDLSSTQREEVRADLGALQRLIDAGYNPWAGYAAMEKFARLESAYKKLNLGFSSVQVNLRLPMTTYETYFRSHPKSSLRMLAMKAFIEAKTRSSEIASVVTKPIEPLSSTMALLHWRTKLWTSIFYSPRVANIVNTIGLVCAGHWFIEVAGLDQSALYKYLDSRIGDYTSVLYQGSKLVLEGSFNALTYGTLIITALSAVQHRKAIAEAIAKHGPKIPKATASLSWSLAKSILDKIEQKISETDPRSNVVKMTTRLQGGDDVEFEELLEVLADLPLVNGGFFNPKELKKKQIGLRAAGLRLLLAYAEIVPDDQKPSFAREALSFMRHSLRSDGSGGVGGVVLLDPDLRALHRRLIEALGLRATLDALNLDAMKEFIRTLYSPQELRLMAMVKEAQSKGSDRELGEDQINEAVETIVRRLADTIFVTWQKIRFLDELEEGFDEWPAEKRLEVFSRLAHDNQWQQLMEQDPYLASRLASWRKDPFTKIVVARYLERILKQIYGADGTKVDSQTARRWTEFLMAVIDGRTESFQGIRAARKSIESQIAAHRGRLLGDKEARSAVESRMAAYAFSTSFPEIPRSPRSPLRRLRVPRLRALQDAWLHDKIFKDGKWAEGFKSVTEVKSFVTRVLGSKGLDPALIASDLAKLILARPELVSDLGQVHVLLREPMFWPVFMRSSRAVIVESSFENAFLRQLSEKTIGRGRDQSAPWFYEPATADRLHRLILDKLGELKELPRSWGDKLTLWASLSDRGVTATTDAMAEELYSLMKAAGLGGEQINSILLKSNRIWDPNLRGRILADQLTELKQYQAVLREPKGARRVTLVAELLAELSSYFPAKGQVYAEFLEALSWRIHSTYEEARIIEREKLPRTQGEKIEDLTVRMLSELVETVIGWKKPRQWEFIRFLRGEIPASLKMEEAFGIVGAERVRRMFFDQNVLVRAGLIDAILADPDGLLPTVKPGRGWTRAIMDHLLGQFDSTQAEVARDLLEGIVVGLERTNNRPLQTAVLSYILAHRKSETSGIGKILVEFLDRYGTTGRKIGQAIAAAEILPPEETKELRRVQEHASAPTRWGMYQDLEEAPQDVIERIELQDLIGSASVKYAIGGQTPLKERMVVKIARKEALAHSPLEFMQLRAMADYLTEKNPKRYGVLKRIIYNAIEGVEQELDFANEVQMSELARKQVYAAGKVADPTYSPPREWLVSDRVVFAEFAEGSSVHTLPREKQAEAALKILSEESAVLMRDYGKTMSVEALSQTYFHFDPDRHPGNNRVSVDASGVVRNRPIDWGQMTKMSYLERRQVVELFAAAQIFSHAGVTKWGVDNLKAIVGAEFPDKVMAKALKAYFPAKKMRPITAYQSLLSALERGGVKLPGVFDAFTRALIQLNPYRNIVGERVAASTGLGAFEAAVRELVGRWAVQLRIEMTGLEQMKFLISSETSRGGQHEADGCESALIDKEFKDASSR